MRSVIIPILAAMALAACENPTAQQAVVDTRHDPRRADTMVAVNFASGGSQLSGGQLNEIRALVATSRQAQRDEFAVVSDGSGGAAQQLRAHQVGQTLSEAGARWVTTAVEPAMVTGPDSVVIVRSEYLIGTRNCPNYNPSSYWNPNEATSAGFGCADAYNMGQMLARPRDAAIGRSPGPADGTVNAAAIQRYQAGRVRALDTTGIVGLGSSGGGGGGGGAAAGGGGGTGSGQGAGGGSATGGTDSRS